MKRLIRDKATGNYLQRDASWGEARSARHFDDLSDLVQFIQLTGSANFELVLSILDEPSENDITIGFDTLNELNPHLHFNVLNFITF
jgi:hypothetical protein